MADEFKAIVDVSLNTTSLSNIQNQIESLGKKGIKVDIKGTEEFERFLKTLNKIDSKNATPNVNSSGIAKAVNETEKLVKNINGIGKAPKQLNIFDDIKVEAQAAEKQVKDTVTEISDAAQRIVGLTGRAKQISFDMGDTSKSKEELRSLGVELDKVMSKINKIYNDHHTSFTDEDFKEIDRAAGASAEKIEQSRAAMNRLSASSKSLLGIQKELASARASGNTDSIKVLEASAESAEKAYRELYQSMESVFTLSDRLKASQLNVNMQNSMQSYADKRQAKAISIKDRFGATSDDSLWGRNDSANVYRAKYEGMSAQIAQLNAESAELDAHLSGLKAKVSALGNAVKNGSYDQIIKAEKEFNNQLKRTSTMYDEVYAKQKKSKSIDSIRNSAKSLENQKQVFSLQIDNWLKNNSAAAKDFGDQLRVIQQRLRSADSTQLGHLKSEFKQATLEAKNMGVAQMSVGDRLKRQAVRYSAYLSVASFAFEGAQALRSMFQNTVDVDTAMVELRRVSDATETQYTQMFDSMTESAKKYGSTLTDIINATADWTRAGVSTNLEDNLQLAEITTMYQKVADIDADEASKNLLTAYKGFQDYFTNDTSYGDTAVGAAERIADVFNELDNNYAVTAAGVGEAMARSAASMSAANNTFEETAALITGMTEVTQDAEMSGNALKVVSMRIRGMKGELEDLGEEVDENVTNTSKMQGQILNLTHGKVNIFDNNGNFKSTYEIMQGIAKEWKNISDTDQAQLLEIVAGKHRANAVASLMNNFDRAEDALASSIGAQGSARKEYDKYLNSVQAHINQLQTSWQALSTTTMSTGFLNNSIDAVRKLVDALNWLIDKVGVIPTVAGVAAAALSFKNIGLVKVAKDADGAAKSLTIFGNQASIIKDIFKGGFGSAGKSGASSALSKTGEMIKADTVALANYARAVDAGISKKTALDKYMSKSSDIAFATANRYDSSNINELLNKKNGRLNTEVLRGMAKDQKGALITSMAQDGGLKNQLALMDMYNNRLKQLGMTQKEFTGFVAAGNQQNGKFFAGLKGGVATGRAWASQLVAATAKTVALTAASMALNMALTMGIGVAITAIIGGISKLINYYDDLADKVKETNDNFEDQRKTLNQNKDDFENAADRYFELSSGGKVDSLGGNVSLSTDEYNELIELRNKIAEQTPSLVAGYDAEGNAILKAADSAEALKNAYNQKIADNNNELLDKKSDIYKDFDHDIQELKGRKYAADNIKDVLGSSDISKTLKDFDSSQINSLYNIAKKNSYFKDANKESMFASDEHKREKVEEAIQSNSDAFKQIVSEYEKDAKTASTEMQNVASAYVSNQFLALKDDSGNLKAGYGKYSEFTDKMQEIVNKSIGQIDYSQFAGKGEGAVTKYIDDMLNSFQKLQDAGDFSDIENLFDLQTKFQAGDISLAQYTNAVNEASSALSQLDKESQKTIYTTLGFKYEDGKDPSEFVYEAQENLKTNLKSSGFGDDTINRFVNNLNGQELSIAAKVDYSTVKPTLSEEDKEKAKKELEEFGKGGNVDLTMRPTIDTKKLKDAGWKDVTNDLTDDITSSVSTTFKSTFSTGNGKNTIAASFTPIIADENGNLKGVLSPSELQKYAEDVLSGVRTDDLKLQVGAQFTGEDALDEAVAKARKYHQAEEDYYKDEANLIRQMKVENAMSDNGDIDYSAESEWASKLSNIMKESNSATGATIESVSALRARYSELEGYDPAKLFERTASGIRVNTEEVQKLEKAQAEANIETNNAKVDTLYEEYDRLAKSVDTYTSASERAKAVADMSNIKTRIEELEAESAAYEGLTSSYQKWVDAQANGEEGDQYEAARESWKKAQELYKKGKVGTNEFAAAIEYATGKDTSEMSPDKIADSYDAANKKMTRYFTESSKGTERFLEDMSKVNDGIKKTKDGKWKINIDSDELAKDAKMSKDAVEDILKNGTDYGLELHWESVYDASDSLDELLSKVQDAAKEAQKIAGTNYNFSFNSDDIKDLDDQIANAEKLLDNFKTDGKVNFDLEGTDEAQTVLATLIRQKQAVEGKELIEFDVTTVGDEKVQSLVTNAKALQDNLGDYELNVAIGEDASESVKNIKDTIKEVSKNADAYVDIVPDSSKFKEALDTIKGNIKADATLDPTALNTLQEQINGIPAKITADVTPSEDTPAHFANLTGNATITVKPDKTDLGNDFKGNATIAVKPSTTDLGSSFTGSATVKLSTSPADLTATVKVTGGGKVDGTAHVLGTAFAGGTAFAQGNWGTKDSGTALMGELGTELLVRNGRWYTVGEDGAGFYGYKKGDIIFNAEQTKEIFDKGKITHGSGRGKVYADGTAFAEGNAFNNKIEGGGTLHGSSSSSSSKKTTTSKSKSKSKSKGKGKSKSTKDASEFSDVLDWIEIKLDRLERQIKNLDTSASSIFNSWDKRTKDLNKEIETTTTQIGKLAAAEKKYNDYANKVARGTAGKKVTKKEEKQGKGLTENTKKLLREGKIDITKYKGKSDGATQKKYNLMKEYLEWYNKSINARDEKIEAQQQRLELYMTRFENIATKHEGKLASIEHEKNMIEQRASRAEAMGYATSTKYYDAEKEKNGATISELTKQRNEQRKELQKQLNAGIIKKNTEAYYQQVKAIDETTAAIEEATTAQAELDKKIRETEWEWFDYVQEKISNVANEASFFVDIMSHYKLIDDTGQFTDKGNATAGLYASNYALYKKQAEDYRDQIKKINADIAKDPNNKDLLDHRDELVKSAQEVTKSQYEMIESYKSLVKEGIDKELDSLQELINKRKDALSSQRELYEYEKNVKKQTKEIADLEKQMAAYQGDTSEEAKAKIQELKVSLDDAYEELKSTEYDKMVSDQEKMLDELYDQYEKILNKRLDDFDALGKEMMDKADANANKISTTVSGVAKQIGYDSQYVKNIYDGTSKGVLVDTNDYLKQIVGKLENMKTAADNNAEKDVKDINGKSSGADGNAGSADDMGKQKASEPAKQTQKNNNKKAEVGDRVILEKGAPVYKDSKGKKKNIGETQYSAAVKRTLYITKIDTSKSATKDYQLSTKKSGGKVVGWVAKSRISGYATGKRRTGNEIAWTQENGAEMIVRPSDGAILTPLAKNDSVLNASASGNIWDMANNPTDFIKNNLGFDAADTAVGTESHASYTQNFDKVVFNMPNVKNYEQMLSSMQKDRNFENLVLSMTIDQMAGKSKLGKGKSIR